MSAKEFFTQRNGGKDPDTSTNHGELITPIHAVELMEEYAQSKLQPLTPKAIREEAFKRHAFDFLIGIVTNDHDTFIEGANFVNNKLKGEI